MTDANDIVERLRAGAPWDYHDRHVFAEAADLIESLRAENEALRKDAARYRHMKTHDEVLAYENHIDRVINGEPSSLDDAIDAALANQPAEKC